MQQRRFQKVDGIGMIHTKKASKEIWFDLDSKNQAMIKGKDNTVWMNIIFQDKPINEVGPNGVCMLDVIDALRFRLNQFEKKWPCSENKKALGHLRMAAIALLEKRDRRRKEAK